MLSNRALSRILVLTIFLSIFGNLISLNIIDGVIGMRAKEDLWFAYARAI